MDATQTVTRDELILAALAEGDASTAAIAEMTALPERTVRAGLAHLRKEGLMLAPERGRYRLTGLGRTMSEEVLADPGALRPAPADDAAPLEPTDGPVPDAADTRQPEAAGVSPTLAGVAGFAVGVLATLAWTFLRQTSAASPPAPPTDPLAAYWRPR